MPTKDYPVRIADGATLLTQPTVSLENVPEAGFTRLRNFRRVTDDQIGRAEGWVLFKPNSAGSDNQATFDGSETLLRLAELRRPNGDRVIVGASRTKIKKFNTGTMTWTDLGTGYSAQGKRWQVVTINGYLILNNAVDLPVSYRVEDAAVTPVYEMREVGISSVGRIAEYNGFLFVADITEVKAEQLNKWMNGYGSYVATSTVNKAIDFAIVTGDSGKEFDVTTGATNKTATLPNPVAAPTFWCWIKKADAGIGQVLTLPVTQGESVILTAINDIALVWSDGSRYVAKVFAGGVIPATAPYGIPPTAILNNIPYGTAWSEFGQPTRWAPLFDVYMLAAGTSLTLPFPSAAFVANQTRVAVVGGGDAGGTLGGQSTSPNGILVTAVAGAVITLETSTDASISYPRTVQVTRFSDVSTLVGRAVLQGDGSRIIDMRSLQNQIVFYRETGIYVGRFTGQASAPFTFKPLYEGKNVPVFSDCIGSVNGDFHIYPGVGKRFYMFDGASAPSVFKVCDNAGDLFFEGLSDSAECFVVDNPLTKSLWFCQPARTFMFDYEFRTVSEMDTNIDAACLAIQPTLTDTWFVLGIGKTVFTFGLVTGVAPISTYFRNAVNPGASIISGLIHGGDTISEKDLLMFTPLLASPSPNAALSVQLYSTFNPSYAVAALMTAAVDLPGPAGENYIPTMFRAIFFQYLITLTETTDINVRFSEIQFQLDYLRSGPVPRLNI